MQSMLTAEVQDRSQDRSGKAAEHLQLLRSLSDELERAMQAIARNALAEFEESITNQQILSARLSKLADELSAPLAPEPNPRHSASTVEDDLMHQIHAASNTLQKLNLRYSILLQHSSRSAALMASLFSSLQGNFQEVSGPRSKYQTWSCRM